MFQGERAWHAHDIGGAKFKVMRFSSRRDEVCSVLCHITNFILPRLHLYVYLITELPSFQIRYLFHYISIIHKDTLYSSSYVPCCFSMKLHNDLKIERNNVIQCDNNLIVTNCLRVFYIDKNF